MQCQHFTRVFFHCSADQYQQTCKRKNCIIGVFLFRFVLNAFWMIYLAASWFNCYNINYNTDVEYAINIRGQTFLC